ncbi:hypothetical protein BFP72_12815 [Reichenbachiella sp. 5M10]|nr:hypothetical protein BFP72_12815 [Reichenbachiella sp. 5M10]
MTQLYAEESVERVAQSLGEVKKFNINGTPQVVHYTEEDYRFDSQFWTMAEDAEGVLYFGNNDGVAIYDGERWSLLRLPNGSTVRGLKYASDGNVYVGGYNDLGRIVRNDIGQYKYVSLLDVLRPEDRNFEDIWQIDELDGFVVFRSFKQLIAVKNRRAVTLPAHGQFTRMNVINDHLYVVDHWGIKRLNLKNLETEKLIASDRYDGEELCALLPGRSKRELVIFSRVGKSYSLDLVTSKFELLMNHVPDDSGDQIFCVIKSREGSYFLGMINSKVRVFELTDQRLQEGRTFENLQNNTVLNLYQTRDGSVWALLNKGIDCIEIPSHISKLFEDAAVYDALLYDHKFYVATNQGVYVATYEGDEATLSSDDFSIVPGLEAQAWSLHLYEGKIVVAHDRGVYVLEGQRTSFVNQTNGVWKVIPIEGKPHHYLACAYDGLYLIKYERGSFVYKNKINGFDISGRDIMQSVEDNTFWVCHGYKGVFRIKIDDDYQRTTSLEQYTDQNGLPSAYNNNISIWKGDTVFTTVDGLYRYDRTTNQFELYEELTAVLGRDHLIRKILQDDDKTWYVKEDEMGFFYTSDTSRVYRDLFLSLKGSLLKSMELILPLSDSGVLVGTNNGLYKFNIGKRNEVVTAPTVITQVKYKNQEDSVIYCPLVSQRGSHLKLPNNTSSLTFNFATPRFSTQKDLQYSYKLESMDRQWSEWDEVSEKEYSYLKAGQYTLKVRSRTTFGDRSEEVAYVFEIEPVWYQTKGALTVLAVLAVIGLVLARTLVRQKIKRTKEEAHRVKTSLELEIKNMTLERENENIELEKKRLEEDVVQKSKELANYTILLLKKRELLAAMAAELKELRSKIKNASNREIVRSMTRRINLNLQDEEHLNVFDANFERVHQEFFNELKVNFPDLTQKELRLCGFVNMNLTNKEIAAILNISVRGVETARYRLRKRLSLGKEINMVEFLATLSSTSEEGVIEESDEDYFND